MNKELLFRDAFTIVLEPVTPVHVWDGRDAIVGIDALIRGNELVLVDLEDTLKRAPEEFLRRFAEFSRSVESRKAIASLLKELESAKLISGLRIPIKTKSRIELNSRVKVLHKHIVPGSELKGYIRTGIIKGLLKEASDTARILREGVDLEREAKDVGTGVEARLLRSPRLKKQGGFIDALSAISVSDPLIYENVETSLRELRVVHTPSLDLVASLLAITFSKGRLKYRVTVRKTVKQAISGKPDEKDVTEELERILERMSSVTDKISNRDWLLNTLREFGCDLIKIELEKIKGVDVLRNYEDLLRRLEKDLCGKKVSCVPARVGFMTGHESKTIMPEIKRYSPEIYDKVKNRMRQELGRVWDALTLKLVGVDDGLVGVGWCRICLE